MIFFAEVPEDAIFQQCLEYEVNVADTNKRARVCKIGWFMLLIVVCCRFHGN